MNLIKKFFVEEEGVNLTEYAMLLAFIALVVIAGVTSVGTALNEWFTGLGTRIGLWAN